MQALSQIKVVRLYCTGRSCQRKVKHELHQIATLLIISLSYVFAIRTPYPFHPIELNHNVNVISTPPDECSTRNSASQCNPSIPA